MHWYTILQQQQPVPAINDTSLVCHISLPCMHRSPHSPNHQRNLTSGSNCILHLHSHDM